MAHQGIEDPQSRLLEGPASFRPGGRIIGLVPLDEKVQRWLVDITIAGGVDKLDALLAESLGLIPRHLLQYNNLVPEVLLFSAQGKHGVNSQSPPFDHQYFKPGVRPGDFQML